MKDKKEQIDPNILIDVGVSLISDKPPKTLVGRILRWIKKINTLRNGLNVKIKQPKAVQKWTAFFYAQMLKFKK